MQNAPSLAALTATLMQNPDDLNAYYQLSALELFNDNYEASLNALLEVVKQDQGAWGALARKGMLAIFHILGNDNEVTKQYRSLLLELKT